MSRKTRNLIWSVPLVAVLAVAGALALFMALAPNAALAHDPPGPVTSLAATPDGYDTIKLSWGAPSTGGTPTGYRIDVSIDTLAWESLVDNIGNTRTTYTHEGLKPASERFYRVFAVNAAGAGPSPVVQDQLFASATTGEAQAPSVVLNLRAMESGSSKVVLTWAQPADNGGAEIVRYCIVADGNAGMWPADGTDPNDCADADAGVDTNIMDLDGGLIAVSGKKTTFEHKEQVSTAQNWRYRVYAINSANESEESSDDAVFSNIARARTAGQSDLGKPTDLRIAPDGTDYDMIYLYWNWPKVANKADTTVTAFQYQSRTKKSGISTWPSYASPTLTFPQPVLVSALVSDALHQAASSPGTFVAEGDQTRYRVRSVKTIGATVETSGWTESSVLTHQGMHQPDQADDPNTVTLTGMPTDLEADEEKSLDYIDLTWEKASTARASYIDMALESQVTDDGPRLWIRLAGNTSYSRETYNHIRLEPGQTIHYRITPWHSRGFGTANMTTGSTKTAYEPQAVRGLSVAADGQDKLTVSWTRTLASENGGSAVVGYLVQVAKDIDNDVTLDLDAPIAINDDWLNVDTTTVSGATVTAGANGGSYTYTSDEDELAIIDSEGLSAGSTRWFRVFAINSVNKAAPSINDRQSAVWEDGTTAGPSVPGAPEYLVAETARDSSGTELTERGVVLLWTEPEYSAGDTIRGYIIERSVDGGAWTELKSTVDGTDRFYTDYTDTEEPTATELRGYRVRVVTKGGTSVWSNVAYYPHALAMHEAPVRTSPTDLKVTVTGTIVSFTWTDGVMADDHTVGLVDLSDYSVPHTDTVMNGVEMHEYTNVAPGRYMVAVLGSPWMAMYYDIEIIEVMSGN